jgi:hypothetical protein
MTVMTDAMPHRFEFAHQAVVSIGSTIAAMASLLAAAHDSMPGGGIYDNSTLRLVCLAGSIGGAMVSLIIFPPRTPSIRLLAFKFIASGLCGALFTPLVFRYLDWPIAADTVLPVSGGVSLFAIGAIRSIHAQVIRKLADKLGLKTDQDSDV